MFTSLEAASARQDGSLAAPDKRSRLVGISGHGAIGAQHGGVHRDSVSLHLLLGQEIPLNGKQSTSI